MLIFAKNWNMIMIKRILCLLFGHDFNSTIELFSILPDGKKLYKQEITDCKRCGKRYSNGRF